MSATAAREGRLTATVGPEIERILYRRTPESEVVEELERSTTVDLAHVVMLAERGLVPRAAAARLLRAIAALRAQRFAPLLQRPWPRGAFLAYEQHLIATAGADAGGALQTGRSRNDLKATVAAMRLRTAIGELVAELVRAHEVLLERAAEHRATLMPVHTHFQSALPATYGWYLAGVALALGRDVGALRHAADGLRRCPLGAGAAAGTELPIDPARTAALLGFAAPPVHALDAVASRDALLRALAAAAAAAVTLSRLAADLQLWTTAEVGFVELPDRLVGGSSAMPQKRNAFLLEHVKGKAAAAIGAWTAATAGMRGAPFTNSIEVGTEAVAAAWPGLAAARDAAVLTREIVAGAEPAPDRMLAGAEEGLVGATALANRLVAAGVPFRAAHELVGGAVREGLDRGAVRLEELDLPAEAGSATLSLARLVAEQRVGGGPGAVEDALAQARRELDEHRAWSRASQEREAAARDRLAAAVAALAAGGAEGGAAR